MNKSKMFEAYHKIPKNFITPKILKFEAKGNSIIELSCGLSLYNTPLWGVSELVYTGKTRYGVETTGNGKAFSSPREARAYYKLLLQ